MRRRAGLVVALIVLGTLVGCGPGPSGQVAIRKAGAGFELVFALCPGDRISYVSVFDIHGSPDRAWRVTVPSPGADVVGLRLFEAPSGWTVDDGSLTEFEQGRTYDVNVLPYLKKRSVLPEFGLEDLAGLADGEVLARDGDRSTAMSSSEFEQRATADC